LLNLPEAVSEGFQLNLSVSRSPCLILFVQLRNKRYKIAVSSVAILADLLRTVARKFSIGGFAVLRGGFSFVRGRLTLLK